MTTNLRGSWLDRVNTTNLTAVAAVLLAVGFVIAVTWAAVRGVKMDAGVLSVVAGVIVAVGGWAWARFKTKRETAWVPPQTESEVRTGEPVRPPPSAATPTPVADAVVRSLSGKPAVPGVPVLPDEEGLG